MSTANVLRAKDIASTATSALAFIASNGIVLVSAKGPVPRLIDVVAGAPISGNWWSHPRASHIYNVLVEVSFPDWVPREVATQAVLISERDAVNMLAPWLHLIDVRRC